MFSFHRLPVLIIILSLANAFPNSAAAQKNETPDYSSVRLIEDARFRQVINVARDCLQDKEYGQAIEALDAVLKEEKDYFVRLYEPDPANPKKEIIRWTSVRGEAN